MKDSKRYKTFIDLFSGIGGFRIGMELANSVHDGAIKCMHEIGIDISNQ